MFAFELANGQQEDENQFVYGSMIYAIPYVGEYIPDTQLVYQSTSEI